MLDRRDAEARRMNEAGMEMKPDGDEAGYEKWGYVLHTPYLIRQNQTTTTTTTQNRNNSFMHISCH
jgi:hypothetical protein